MIKMSLTALNLQNTLLIFLIINEITPIEIRYTKNYIVFIFHVSIKYEFFNIYLLISLLRNLLLISAGNIIIIIALERLDKDPRSLTKFKAMIQVWLSVIIVSSVFNESITMS